MTTMKSMVGITGGSESCLDSCERIPLLLCDNPIDAPSLIETLVGGEGGKKLSDFRLYSVILQLYSILLGIHNHIPLQPLLTHAHSALNFCLALAQNPFAELYGASLPALLVLDLLLAVR